MKKWKNFKIEEVFDIQGTITTIPSKLHKKGLGITPRITCSSLNNGLEDFYDNEHTEKFGCITIDSATIGFVVYHAYNFIATDHVEKIVLKKQRIMDKYLGVFLVTCIKKSTHDKYGYGYKFNQNRIKKQKIKLPLDDNDTIDWDFMRECIKNKEAILLQKYITHKNLL